MSPPPLPPPFTHTFPAPTLLIQGAEGLVYRTHFLTPTYPCALKHRPPKPYRHPTLDARLTRHRILSEARTLVKCRREGVVVPGVLALEVLEGCEGVEEGRKEARGGGWMLMEWIEGRTVREVLVEGRREMKIGGEGKWERGKRELMGKIGRAVGRMHEVGVVHGDLTTSNLMLRPWASAQHHRSSTADEGAATTTSTATATTGELGGNQEGGFLTEGEIVLIDFGLAAQSVQDEEKAVDLYVLERAFGSTHPEAEEGFREVLAAYGDSYKGAKVVLRRLEEVRMRGRKRSMLG